MQNVTAVDVAACFFLHFSSVSRSLFSEDVPAKVSCITEQHPTLLMERAEPRASDLHCRHTTPPAAPPPMAAKATK
eukprot:CAMPEP_0115344808 /NCGR_PEP_ID=MMETSP0270-20121206/93481_1 /TAXON_ID=71861 /ORGANISM="Scrippsiella trochoidea, Strain CCMP3099" /LENGTH=75 /DNA_ID=CAMNT_0002766561 /DNA_START=271 /DNA_END=495 /DNA_ORIENTATION=+